MKIGPGYKFNGCFERLFDMLFLGQLDEEKDAVVHITFNSNIESLHGSEIRHSELGTNWVLKLAGWYLTYYILTIICSKVNSV